MRSNLDCYCIKYASKLLYSIWGSSCRYCNIINMVQHIQYLNLNCLGKKEILLMILAFLFHQVYQAVHTIHLSMLLWLKIPVRFLKQKNAFTETLMFNVDCSTMCSSKETIHHDIHKVKQIQDKILEKAQENFI